MQSSWAAPQFFGQYAAPNNGCNGQQASRLPGKVWRIKEISLSNGWIMRTALISIFLSLVKKAQPVQDGSIRAVTVPAAQQPDPISTSAFGVDLFIPVNGYQKTLRTIKYALLCILLTFAAFFLIETAHKKSVHPFQYGLVGLALILFYTLLLIHFRIYRIQYSLPDCFLRYYRADRLVCKKYPAIRKGYHSFISSARACIFLCVQPAAATGLFPPVRKYWSFP